MELGLSLGGGETSKPVEQQQHQQSLKMDHSSNNNNKGLGFCMGLDVVGFCRREKEKSQNDLRGVSDEKRVSIDPPLQLDLLPLAPVVPVQSENGNTESGSSGQLGGIRGFDVNLLPSGEEGDDGATVSSPNSTVSSFQIDFCSYRNNKRDSEMAGLNEVDAERTSSRASDDDENGLTRKKLRLSKEQSAYLEDSFKEHNTLNPKQKQALAKQLNLRPRQVEVWFQNRRARTKLKQTEVDCEYLKRCCETLTEENRRLHKELQELRTLKTSHPFYMQLPATTLTMCPSCERVATANNHPSASADNSTITTTVNTPKPSAFSLTKPRFYPFSHAHAHAHAHQSAAS